MKRLVHIQKRGAMPYYLKHHFDPDFNHLKRAPSEREDGRLDHYNLNYVQNVLKGDLLAEWVEVPEADASELDQRFIYPKKLFPKGFRVEADPENPDRLLAADDGYVFYDAGLIRVKKLLNVRQDVDFSTGNVSFVSNMVVHGSVMPGFKVQAKNVLVRGNVDAGTVTALESIVCEGGVKGGDKGFLDAGKTVKLNWCERALVHAGLNVLIDAHCLHSRLYAGRRLHVRGRFMGGTAFCHDFVCVEGGLGGPGEVETQLVLGYNPRLLYKDRLVIYSLRALAERLRQYEMQAGRGKAAAEEYAPLMEDCRVRMRTYEDARKRIWERITAGERLDSCRVIAPGRVMPGVEISIGPAYLFVDQEYENVHFRCEDGEIVVGSPALA